MANEELIRLYKTQIRKQKRMFYGLVIITAILFCLVLILYTNGSSVLLVSSDSDAPCGCEKGTLLSIIIDDKLVRSDYQSGVTVLRNQRTGGLETPIVETLYDDPEPLEEILKSYYFDCSRLRCKEDGISLLGTNGELLFIHKGVYRLMSIESRKTGF